MFIWDGFLGRRNIGFEEVDGKRVLCRTPPFLLPFFDSAVPTCTGAVSDQVAESSSVPAPVVSSVAPTPVLSSTTPIAIASSIAPVAPAPPVTSASAVVSTTSILPPPEPTTVVKTIIPPATTVFTTATVIPETSATPIIPSVISSSVTSIPPVTTAIPPISSTSSVVPIPIPPISSTSSVVPIPIPISTVESSESPIASTTIAPVSSPFVQTSPLEETSAPTTSFTPTSTSTSSAPIQSTPSAISSGENEIISEPTHLNTDAKVAIITAITLSILFLVVGFLYILHRRKRNAIQKNQNPFTNNDFVIDDGEEAGLVMAGAGNGMMKREEVAQRELGPNGYPLDIKMEDGTLLGHESRPESAAAVRGRSPPLMQNPVYDRSRVVSPDGGSTLGEMKSFGPPLVEATAMTGNTTTTGNPTGNVTQNPTRKGSGKKVDIVTLPTPAKIQVARAVSDSGSFSSQQTREDRINALSMARNISSAGTSSSLSNRTTPTHGILKNKLNTSSPSSTPERSHVHHRKRSSSTNGMEGRKSRRGSGAHGRKRSGTLAAVGTGGEVPLSDASRELSQLTREYDVERKEREREREGSHKKCMDRDKDVRVHSPTLPALDLRNVGSYW